MDLHIPRSVPAKIVCSLTLSAKTCRSDGKPPPTAAHLSPSSVETAIPLPIIPAKIRPLHVARAETLMFEIPVLTLLHNRASKPVTSWLSLRIIPEPSVPARTYLALGDNVNERAFLGGAESVPSDSR